MKTINSSLLRKFFLGITLCVVYGLAFAAEAPYDESADAHADIRQARIQANASNKPILIVFGANWCPDCRILDTALKTGSSATLMSQDFKVVKVNVGRYDRNLEIAQDYGVPLKKGIPAVVIINAGNAVLFATRGGELADARGMGEAGLHDFFVKAIANSKSL